MSSLEQAHQLPPGLLHKVIFEPGRLSRAITGQITDAQWRSEIAAALSAVGIADAEVVVGEWSAIVPQVDAGVVTLLRQVRCEIPVALISNATTRLEADLDAHRLDDFASLLVNSCRVGIAKPDAGIYRYAAELVGVHVGECLFVDDSARNVDAARELGMSGVLFAGVEDLRRALYG